MEAHGMDVGHFFAVLVTIWIGAKLAGELAERVGQPAVLGELLVGVILGPSLLGLVPASDHTLHLLAEVGVCILLFEIGLETNLGDFVKVGGTSLLVATIGVFVPFAVGFISIYELARIDLIAINPDSIALIAIFTGASLTATSVGITARVLADLGQLSAPESKVILGAAVIDDVLGIVILAVVSSLAAATASGIAIEDAVSVGSIFKILSIAIGFLVVAVVVGKKLVHPIFDLVDQMRVRGVLFVAALSFALAMAFLAKIAGSAMIIGAFAAGILLAETDKFHIIEERLKPVADIFTPIFFVLVGAQVDVRVFFDGGPALVVGLILFAVATAGKLVAGWGAIGKGGKGMNKLAIGVGMIPRGEVGLIFAQEGLKTNLLSKDMFAAVTFMVITTTLIAPPLLKVVFRKPEDPDQVEPDIAATD